MMTTTAWRRERALAVDAAGEAARRPRFLRGCAGCVGLRGRSRRWCAPGERAPVGSRGPPLKSVDEHAQRQPGDRAASRVGSALKPSVGRTTPASAPTGPGPRKGRRRGRIAPRRCRPRRRRRVRRSVSSGERASRGAARMSDRSLARATTSARGTRVGAGEARPAPRRVLGSCCSSSSSGAMATAAWWGSVAPVRSA